MVVVVLDLFLILLLLVWRQVLRRQEMYKQAFVSRWRQVLMAYALARPQRGPLPVLKTRDHTLFFMLWNDTQQQLVGSASPRLNQLIYDLGLEKHVIRRLKAGKLREKMVACQTVGHLENLEAAWPSLVGLAFSEHDMLAFFALQALIQMSPEATLPILLKVLYQEKTAQSRILGLFRRYPSPALVRPLLEALQDTLYTHAYDKALKIIALLEVLPYPSVLPTMRQILVETEDPVVMVSCLRVMADLHDPWCLGLSLPYLHHEDWTVRQAAVTALGKVAQAPQIPVLLACLNDVSVWVAEAALEALWQIPGLRREKLKALAQQHGEAQVRERVTQFLGGKVSDV